MQVGDAHDAARAKRVDLAYGHDLGEHVAQPLRVEEEQVAQRHVVVVHQYAVLVQELRRLEDLVVVAEADNARR